MPIGRCQREYGIYTGDGNGDQGTDNLKMDSCRKAFDQIILLLCMGGLSASRVSYQTDHNGKLFKQAVSVGETMPVLYHRGKVYKAYVAKKDCITGAYLPLSKNYNAPFIISVVLFVIGFLFYTNSPILKWYTNAGEITIGKKKRL